MFQLWFCNQTILAAMCPPSTFDLPVIIHCRLFFMYLFFRYVHCKLVVNKRNGFAIVFPDSFATWSWPFSFLFNVDVLIVCFDGGVLRVCIIHNPGVIMLNVCLFPWNATLPFAFLLLFVLFL